MLDSLFPFILLSPTLFTFIDFIISFISSPHVILILSYPSLHNHYFTPLYLSFKEHWFLFYDKIT